MLNKILFVHSQIIINQYGSARLSVATIDAHIAKHFLTLLTDNCPVCQFSLSWPGIHHYAGVHLEPAESFYSNELLWSVNFQGTFPALGPVWFLTHAGKFRHG